MTAPSPQQGRIKVLAVLAVALFGECRGRRRLGFDYGATRTSSTSSTGSPSTGRLRTSSRAARVRAHRPRVDQQLTPTTFDAVTEYNISANRTPAGIAVNQTDGFSLVR